MIRRSCARCALETYSPQAGESRLVYTSGGAGARPSPARAVPQATGRRLLNPESLTALLTGAGWCLAGLRLIFGCVCASP